MPTPATTDAPRPPAAPTPDPPARPARAISFPSLAWDAIVLAFGVVLGVFLVIVSQAGPGSRR